jgi:hypothetical protein
MTHHHSVTFIMAMTGQGAKYAINLPRDKAKVLPPTPPESRLNARIAVCEGEGGRAARPSSPA